MKPKPAPKPALDQVLAAIKHLDRRIDKLIRHLGAKPDSTDIHFAVAIAQQSSPSGDPHIMLNLSSTQQATLSLIFTPKAARPDGVPEWATSDAAIVSVTPAADGLSAVAKATGIGVAAISVTGDKKHGAEVSAFVGSIDVQVNEADVESVEIVAGTPEEQA